MTKKIPDRGILFAAYTVNETTRAAVTRIGTVTAFSPTPASTVYEKRDENNDRLEFEGDNFDSTVQLTVQHLSGAVMPEANEEIALVPLSVYHRKWFGIYRLVQDPTPGETQNGVASQQVTAMRSMNGTYLQTQVPIQPAMFKVEAAVEGSGSMAYTVRNVGGVAAAAGEAAYVIDPDRLIEVTGFDWPASYVASTGLFTPASEVAAGGSATIEMVAETP